jgi:hypothetical protein
MNQQTKCPKCGCRIAVENTGDLEHLRCTNCSWELVSTIYRNVDVAVPELFRATLRWNDGRVSVREAMAAKQLIPELNDISIAWLLQRFRESATADLGIMRRPAALELQMKAKQQGLSVILEPLLEC